MEARASVAAGESRPSLHTERLDIVPFTPPLIEVALRSRAALQQALGAQVPEGWLTEEGDEILRLLAEGLRSHPAEQHWGWWLIVQRAERVLVGEVSFRAPPDRSGTVEIGYGVDVALQGRGYATEAAGAVLASALGQPGVRRVVALCLQDNGASQRVLEKLGFQRVGVEGALLVWERSRRRGCTLSRRLRRQHAREPSLWPQSLRRCATQGEATRPRADPPFLCYL